ETHLQFRYRETHAGGQPRAQAAGHRELRPAYATPRRPATAAVRCAKAGAAHARVSACARWWGLRAPRPGGAAPQPPAGLRRAP
ncbi:unnamed protein product, partial [Urochloa humidicola]